MITFIATFGSFIAYIYSAPPLKLKANGWTGTPRRLTRAARPARGAPEHPPGGSEGSARSFCPWSAA